MKNKILYIVLKLFHKIFYAQYPAKNYVYLTSLNQMHPHTNWKGDPSIVTKRETITVKERVESSEKTERMEGFKKVLAVIDGDLTSVTKDNAEEVSGQLRGILHKAIEKRDKDGDERTYIVISRIKDALESISKIKG